jgi:hypothetical protein
MLSFTVLPLEVPIAMPIFTSESIFEIVFSFEFQKIALFRFQKLCMPYMMLLWESETDMPSESY